MVKNLSTKVKRGDTIIEVMFAFAVFALVAILSIAMMNAGVATSERSLELVVARNEINAQAEAIRFIHSSYISELTLPTCDKVKQGEKCQQFSDLWARIKSNAIGIDVYTNNIPTPLNSCQEVYDNDSKDLVNTHAFVLNSREISSVAQSINPTATINKIYIPAGTTRSGGSTKIFQPAPYGARLVYSNGRDEDEGYNSSIQQGTNKNPINYINLVSAEGIWVVAIKSNKTGSNGAPQYYDFRIQACWYGSGNVAPTTLDTVIRLVNPENL